MTSKPGKPKADVKNHNLLVPLLQVCFLIHSVFHNTFLILGVAYVEGGVRGWAPLTKVKYALSILQIYWKYTSKVYLKHNSSILEAYFKYTSSILQPVELQKKYTSSLYYFDKRSTVEAHYVILNQHFNVNLKYTSSIL